MPEFLKLIPPQQAKSIMFDALSRRKTRAGEMLPTAAAQGRVLSNAITAPIPLPPFKRSTVDGFAVLAKDTFGASGTLPVYLKLLGEIEMGSSRPPPSLETTQTIAIHTGGMLPDEADAVVMIEDTQRIAEREIEVLKAVAPGENVLQKGEDVQQGNVVIHSGAVLRAQEIGGLMALGIVEVEVAKKPRVGILSTGNEVVHPKVDPQLGQIRDVNSYTLSCLIEKAGGEPHRWGIVPDNFDALLERAEHAHQEDEMVIITAGSSVSVHDLTSNVIEKLGEPGVLVHGVAIKPGKPTILAVADGVPIIGLPGNPVSALLIAKLFASPLIKHLLGVEDATPEAQVVAKLSINLNSQAGREDYVPVQLVREDDHWIAEPVFGRSNLIFTLVRAGGLIRIPPQVTGLPAGSEVAVELF